MPTFPLIILTPEGIPFEGQVRKLILRSVSGELAVLAGHIPLVCPLSSGRVIVETEQARRTGQCTGGFLSVAESGTVVFSRDFRWEAQ